jgi:hypothetical protein
MNDFQNEIISFFIIAIVVLLLAYYELKVTRK